MPIVLANAKKAQLLDQERTYLNTLRIKLYVNDYVPDGAMVAASFTPPADTGMSGFFTLAFLQAFLNGANQGELDSPQVTWTSSFSNGAFTVYGYYVVDPNDANKPVYAERAAVPFGITGAGQTYSITPRKLMDTM